MTTARLEHLGAAAVFGSPGEELVTIGGRDWARNFPRVCPFCGVTFYGWAPWPWPETWRPGTKESLADLVLGGGQRSTCGRIDCHDEAQAEFVKWEAGEWGRRIDAKREREAFDRAAAENDRKEAAAGVR